jgi:hypothetical protein
MHLWMLALDCQLVKDKINCTVWPLPTTNLTAENIKIIGVYIFVYYFRSHFRQMK